MNSRDDVVAALLRAALDEESNRLLDRSLAAVDAVVDVMDPVSNDELIACALATLLVATGRDTEVDSAAVTAVAKLRQMISTRDELFLTATQCARELLGLAADSLPHPEVMRVQSDQVHTVTATIRSEDLPFRSTALGWKSNVLGERQRFPLRRFVEALAPRPGDARFLTLISVTEIRPAVRASGLSYVLDLHETADRGLLGFWFKINERLQVLSCASFSVTVDDWRSQSSDVRSALSRLELGSRTSAATALMRQWQEMGQRRALWWVSAADPDWEGPMRGGGEGAAPRALITAIAACNRLLAHSTRLGGVDGWRQAGSGWHESSEMSVWVDVAGVTD